MMKKLALVSLSVIMTLGISGPLLAAVPETDPEQWIYSYVDSNIERGDIYMEGGYPLQAHFHYNLAYVALASFRYSVTYIGKARVEKEKQEADKNYEPASLSEEDKTVLDDFDGGELSSMLEGLLGFANNLKNASDDFSEKVEVLAEKTSEFLGQFGIEIEDEKESAILEEFDTFARISIASPFPHLFQGYIREYAGDDESAVRNYVYALANPWLPEDKPQFYDIFDLPLNELRAVRDRLARKEKSIASKMKFEGPSLDLEPLNWFYPYLWAKTVLAHNGNTEVLKKMESNDQAALKYILGAVYSFPFDANLFAAGAIIAKAAGNHTLFQWFLREGLILDPENSELKQLFNSWDE